MPNDAKLALGIGVGLVIAVAIIFFHKDIVSRGSPEAKPPASVGNPPAPPPGSGNVQGRPLPARPTGLRRHTVAEGDTLYALAERYYGDGERFIDLYQCNRGVLKRPDRLEVGTVLVIPDLPEAP